jgi:plastocyanin
MRSSSLLRFAIASSALAAVAAWSTVASAAGWGSFKGKFVLDGKAPTAAKLKVDKDVEVCAPGGASPLDESLVVSDKGEISNIIVALYVKAGGKKPEVHPDYAAALKTPAEFDNNTCRFEPRVQTVRVGQDLVLKNTDKVGHNVKGDLLANAPFNDNLPAGATIKKTLKTEEKLPAVVSCSIHPWMRGYLIVREDPYVAVSAKDGTFEIKNVPAGEWTFRAWQERSGYVEEVKVNGKATKWSKGQFPVKIADGKDTDFGEIKVPVAEFPAK